MRLGFPKIKLSTLKHILRLAFILKNVEYPEEAETKNPDYEYFSYS